MWRKLIGLVLVLLFAPLAAYSLPSSPPSQVVLSQAEYDQIVAAIIKAEETIKADSAREAKQSKDLKTLSLFCGALVIVDIGAVTLALIQTYKLSLK